MTQYRIQVRNELLQIEGEIDDFTKLQAVPRFNAPDSWVLDLPYSAGSVFEPGWGIIVLRDSVPVFSGPMTSTQRKWNADGDSVTVAGVSDDVILEDRLALPAASPYTASAYDVRTGAAETVLKQYVDANAGPSAAVARAVTGLSIEADAALGVTVTGRARFQRLGELLRELAVAGGDLGFRVVQDAPGSLVFEVYEPVDRTGTAIFSPTLGNLASFELVEQVSTANAGIVAGGGEGTARVFHDFVDATAITRWGRRIETFRDRRDTSDPTELAQTADEELANNAEKTGLSITPIDTTRLAYVADYGLGDKVTVDIDGVQIQDVLREVTITLVENGETVTPTIGTPGTRKDLLGIFDRIRRLDRSVALLQRR